MKYATTSGSGFTLQANVASVPSAATAKCLGADGGTRTHSVAFVVRDALPLRRVTVYEPFRAGVANLGRRSTGLLHGAFVDASVDVVECEPGGPVSVTDTVRWVSPSVQVAAALAWTVNRWLVRIVRSVEWLIVTESLAAAPDGAAKASTDVPTSPAASDHRSSGRAPSVEGRAGLPKPVTSRPSVGSTSVVDWNGVSTHRGVTLPGSGTSQRQRRYARRVPSR
jgi:hypothetical protein